MQCSAADPDINIFKKDDDDQKRKLKKGKLNPKSKPDKEVLSSVDDKCNCYCCCCEHKCVLNFICGWANKMV